MAEIRPPDADLIAEIDENCTLAAKLLHVERDAVPKTIVAALTERVRDARATETAFDDDWIVPFGTLLGEQYVRGFGWHWGEVVWDGDEANASVCVLSPDNALSIQPIWWLDHVITEHRSVNFLLNYNMVEAGNVPPAAPNEAVGFY
jgi:hypothetical protein